MGFLVNSRVLASFCVAGFMMAVAGCQSDDAGSALDAGGSKASEEQVRLSELRAYCPKVTLRDIDAFYDTYEKKGEQDATKLVYRSSISAVTRKCSYAAGSMTMDIAVAGKVVPGPLAKDGTVTMPIRVEVKRTDGEVLYSNLAKYDVAVSRAAGAAQFIFNDPNVTFPTPEAGTILVTVGYDDGQPKKKPSDDEAL